VLTTRLEDILEELGPLPHVAVQPTLSAEPADAKSQATVEDDSPRPAALNLTERQQLILSQLDGNPLHVDQIIDRTALPASQILQDLTLLSLKGLVKRVDGQTYVRATKAMS
jgi:predicted Rossmann fold nucleotide-binding protein DprA/Smf involved in DNA uptake